MRGVSVADISDPVVRERAFRAALARARLPSPVAEHRFARPRRWRFDFAWVDHRVALEVEGGAWTGGRHARGKGFLADCEKYSTAAALGWLLIRVPPAELCALRTLDWIARALTHSRVA